jgi:hypothetical protein
LNPLSVELCKVSLWLESLDSGKPLAFLDHRIKVGNSLIGATPALVVEGIPDEAFTPISGDDKTIATGRKKANRKERESQATVVGDLFAPPLLLVRMPLPTSVLRQGDDGTLDGIKRLEEAVKRVAEDPALARLRLQADYWTAAFLVPKRDEAPFFSTGELRRLARSGDSQLDTPKRTVLTLLRGQFTPFHWHVEFPDVFDAKGEGGFDVLLGNPPWERVKLSEQEFFASRDERIASAGTAATRKRLIADLEKERPVLWDAYREELRHSEAEGHFLRSSGRYPCCGRGDVNTYAVFAELMTMLLAPLGRAGFIVPTGIATDDGNKAFFQLLVDGGRLAGLFDFENRNGIFPGVHRSYKFCLLSVSGSGSKVPAGDFVFFAHCVEDIRDPDRRITLSPEDIARINPNTKTCPIFRTRKDAELAIAMHRRVPAFRENGSAQERGWNVDVGRMFHTSDDSALFMEGASARDEDLPLYEAKCFWQYDHRFATFDGQYREVTTLQKRDARFVSATQYRVNRKRIPEKFQKRLAKWFLAYRRITNATNERTLVASVIPECGLLDSGNIIYLADARRAAGLLACLNSLVVDYCCRQTLGGSNLHLYIFEQLPILPPSVLEQSCPWSKGQGIVDWIVPRVLELVYTAWDLAPFAKACGDVGGPFTWDDERRLALRAELDAAMFHLYGLDRLQVQYVLDTFPGFVRKEKELYGEPRSGTLIVGAYDAMHTAIQGGLAFTSTIAPAPRQRPEERPSRR